MVAHTIKNAASTKHSLKIYDEDVSITTFRITMVALKMKPHKKNSNSKSWDPSMIGRN